MPQGPAVSKYLYVDTGAKIWYNGEGDFFGWPAKINMPARFWPARVCYCIARLIHSIEDICGLWLNQAMAQLMVSSFVIFPFSIYWVSKEVNSVIRCALFIYDSASLFSIAIVIILTPFLYASVSWIACLELHESRSILAETRAVALEKLQSKFLAVALLSYSSSVPHFQ